MDLDINLMRSIYTVLSMVVFLGIVAWAYSKHNKSSFDAAANLPFADDDIDGKRQSGVNNG